MKCFFIVCVMLNVASGLAIANAADWKPADGFLGKYEILEYRLEGKFEKVSEAPTQSGPSCVKQIKYSNTDYFESEAYSCRYIGTQIEIGSTFDLINRTCSKFEINSLKITNSFNIAVCEFYNDKNSYNIDDVEYIATQDQPFYFDRGQYVTSNTFNISIIQNTDGTLTVLWKHLQSQYRGIVMEKVVKLRRIK